MIFNNNYMIFFIITAGPLYVAGKVFLGVISRGYSETGIDVYGH